MHFFELLVIMAALTIAVDFVYAFLCFCKRISVSTLLTMNAAVFVLISNYVMWYSGIYAKEQGLEGSDLAFWMNLLNILLFALIMVFYLYLFNKTGKTSEDGD